MYGNLLQVLLKREEGELCSKPSNYKCGLSIDSIRVYMSETVLPRMDWGLLLGVYGSQLLLAPMLGSTSIDLFFVVLLLSPPTLPWEREFLITYLMVRKSILSPGD